MQPNGSLMRVYGDDGRDQPPSADMTTVSLTAPIQVVSASYFDDFYRAEVDGLYRALTLALGSADLASEAVDEGMARAYQHWPKVSAHQNPAGWVYRVSLNWAISRLRKRNRERLNEDWSAMASGGPQSFLAGAGNIGSYSLDVDLVRALSNLSVDARSAVILRHLFGWSTAETAEAMGIKEGTLKSKLARALAQLRFELQDEQEVRR